LGGLVVKSDSTKERQEELKRIDALIKQFQPGELVLVRMARTYRQGVCIFGIVNDRDASSPKVQKGIDIHTTELSGDIFTTPDMLFDDEKGASLFKRFAVAGRHSYSNMEVPEGNFVLSPPITYGLKLQVIAAKGPKDIEANDPDKNRTITEWSGRGCLGGGTPKVVANPDWKPAFIVFTGRDAILQYLEEHFDAMELSRTLAAIGVEPPAKIMQRAKQEATTQVLQLYSELNATDAARQGLDRRTRSLQRGGVFQEGGALMGVMDKEDVFFITFGERQRLDDRTRSFLSAAESAKKQRPWEYVETVQITPGLQINVREFIEGLSKKPEAAQIPRGKARVAR
jgi:hypothetical protein